MFFNDPATTEIYTLSLPDALPILARSPEPPFLGAGAFKAEQGRSAEIVMVNVSAEPDRWREALSAVTVEQRRDRKSTRLNSSHANISYAVFCLKKKTTHVYEFSTN